MTRKRRTKGKLERPESENNRKAGMTRKPERQEKLERQELAQQCLCHEVTELLWTNNFFLFGALWLLA
jgi:hypothetical protein